MKIKIWQKVLAGIAVLGMVSPTAAVAETPKKSTSIEFTDLALKTDGLLIGQVLNQQGAVHGGAEVVILNRSGEVARTKTDHNGVFAVRGVKGGQYLLATETGATAVRAWAPGTAPPSAVDASRIVEGDEVLRANMFTGMFGGMSTTTMVGLGVGIAAVAIGVGVAVANDDDDDHS